MRREYTWYVRDGVHVRSPVKFDGVPIPEVVRREYEEKWMHSELKRRQLPHRARRKARRGGQGPAVSVPSINEPRFISEAYFLDFKFEPGNYYLAGKETLDGREVLKIDYLPEQDVRRRYRGRRATGTRARRTERRTAKERPSDTRAEKQQEKEKQRRGRDRAEDGQDVAGHAVGRIRRPSRSSSTRSTTSGWTSSPRAGS